MDSHEGRTLNSPPLWTVLVRALGAAFGLLGLVIIAVPRPASILFGIAAEGEAALAYVRALGFRDLALSLYLLVLPGTSLRASRRLLGLSAVIPAGDFALVLAESGFSTLLPLLLHAASGIVLLILAAWPQGRMERRPD